MGKALITGCSSFIGSHLADLVLEKGHDVFGTVYQHNENIDYLKDRITILSCDITDRKRVEAVIRQVKPDYVFHLAAQSLIPLSWQNPEKTFAVNIQGTLYLLDSIRKAGVSPLIEVVCSSSEYGFTYEQELPIKENREFRPSSPYSVSKVAQDMLTYLYWQRYQMRIIRVRPFSIIGPRNTHGACSDFARGIAEVEKGQKGVLSVGNLEAIRDIVDVRDCVKAMWLLAEKGTPGEVYNICSGRGYGMGEILNRLIALSQCKIEAHRESQKLRPLDEPILVGDNSKLGKLGWKPQILIDETLADLLDYWRSVFKER